VATDRDDAEHERATERAAGADTNDRPAAGAGAEDDAVV
jgi:hypothetical protein